MVLAAPAAAVVPLVVLVPHDDELVKTEAAAPGLVAETFPGPDLPGSSCVRDVALREVADATQQRFDRRSGSPYARGSLGLEQTSGLGERGREPAQVVGVEVLEAGAVTDKRGDRT